MPHEAVLKFFASYIESEVGIVYAEHNYFQLQNRLEQIAKLFELDSIDSLFEKTRVGIEGAFKQLLLDTATNNETSFFRDPKVFRALEAELFSPERLAVRRGSPLAIWSAAASSGQEALSTAMLLLEWSKAKATPCDFRIVGTDISERILEKAKAARYSQLEVQRGLAMPLLLQYFRKEADDTWSAKAELTRNVTYRPLNLTEEFHFPAPFDLVLCRNVLIYQSVERKRRILARIHANLAPGGLLVLGSGESVIGLSDAFTQVNSEGAVIYARKG